MASPEYDLHVTAVAWLRVVLPAGSLVHHSPNEGRHNVQYRRKLATLGMRPGWPDLQIVVPTTHFLDGVRPTGVYIELKSPKGRLSPAQKEVIAALVAARRHVCVCRSMYDVESFLRSLLRLRLTTW
jgi:hypothetical protein